MQRGHGWLWTVEFGRSGQRMRKARGGRDRETTVMRREHSDPWPGDQGETQQRKCERACRSQALAARSPTDETQAPDGQQPLRQAGRLGEEREAGEDTTCESLERIGSLK